MDSIAELPSVVRARQGLKRDAPPAAAAAVNADADATAAAAPAATATKGAEKSRNAKSDKGARAARL